MTAIEYLEIKGYDAIDIYQHNTEAQEELRDAGYSPEEIETAIDNCIQYVEAELDLIKKNQAGKVWRLYVNGECAGTYGEGPAACGMAILAMQDWLNAGYTEKQCEVRQEKK